MLNLSFNALLALAWMACVHLCGTDAGPATVPLAWSSTDHWTRQGRAAPWLPPPAQEHGPDAVPHRGAFGWA